MSTETQEKIIDEVLAQRRDRRQWSDWYRRNASAVHGVEPDAPELNINVKADGNQQNPGRPVPQEQTRPIEPTGQTEGEKTPRWADWRTLAAGAAIALGAGGLGWWLQPGEVIEKGVPPVLDRGAPPVLEKAPYSIFQDVEDQGFHLPPKN